MVKTFMSVIKELKGEDYVHSSNTLFHFMNSSNYLTDALKRKALCPRYCNEDISYLNIVHKEDRFSEISILQKCFCDIPLHNIIRKFPIELKENNNLTEDQLRIIPKECSHPDFYGKYAIAFSKKWGEQNKLQPVHYLSEQSECTSQFSRMFCELLEEDDLPASISDALLNWLCYFKPLRGDMRRRFVSNGADSTEAVECVIYKNFHDEHEWRYVPIGKSINGDPLDCLIANDAVKSGVLKEVSDELEKDEYQEIWLKFQYEDIRYIIVPDKSGRLELIKTIRMLPDDLFLMDDIDVQRDILISKILVFDEIIKDF